MDELSYLYEKIYQDLAEDIATGKRRAGDKMPTEQELSSQYDVSRITSKRALNLLAEKGLVTRRRGLGTFVAQLSKAPNPSAVQSLRAKADTATRRIGVLMEDLGESYALGLFYELDKFAAEAGLQLCMSISYGDQHKERAALGQLLSLEVEGILVMPAHGPYYDTDLLRLVLDHFPVVLIDRPLHGIPAPCVYSDNRSGARDLTSALIDLGHVNICYISTDINEAISLEDRHTGYVQTMRSHGLTELPPLILPKLTRFEISTSRVSSVPMEPAEQAVISQWLSENRDITAVIGSEYGVAHQVNKAAKKLGLRVPEDLAITCFDERYGYLGEYDFTHIKQDETAMAQKAIEVLASMLDGKNMRRQTFLIPTHLLYGSST